MEPSPIRTERLSLDNGNILDIPFFSETHVPKRFCSRYARLSAEYIFGFEFPITHAWKMRHNPKIVVTSIDNNIFRDLSKKKKVKSGAMIGVYVPKSQHNLFWRPYTHLSLYLGEKNGNPVFLEQFEDKVRISSLSDYESNGLRLKEILVPADVVPKRIESSA